MKQAGKKKIKHILIFFGNKKDIEIIKQDKLEFYFINRRIS